MNEWSSPSVAQILVHISSKILHKEKRNKAEKDNGKKRKREREGDGRFTRTTRTMKNVIW